MLRGRERISKSRTELRPAAAALALALAALVALPPAAFAGDGNGEAAGLESRLPELETWQLDNGLKVAYMGVHDAPVVTVQLWYHVGSKEEPRNRRGSAHMFEHMMFKGTEHVRPQRHAQYLNELGGQVNAFTTEDVTAYHNTLPEQYLDFAVRLEAERMRNLLFRKDMVDTEREVVKEEIRQQENNPLTKGFLRFLEIAFTEHPYAWTAGGKIEDLDKTTVKDLESFYDTYYVPNNAMLVVVGDVSADEVRASATRWFGDVPKGEEPPRPAAEHPEPEQNEMRREVVEPGQVGVVIGGYHIPAATSDDVYPLQVLSVILSAGRSSRLHRKLVRDEQIAVQAAGQAMVREDPGLFLIFGAYLAPENRDKVEKALLGEIGRLHDEAPTKREVQKAKNQLLSSFAFGLESVTGLARQIGTSWIQTGDPEHFAGEMAKYKAVTADDVQRVAKTYLTRDNLTLVVIPTQAGAASTSGAAGSAGKGSK